MCWGDGVGKENRNLLKLCKLANLLFGASMVFLLDITVDNQKGTFKRRIDCVPDSVLIYRRFCFQTHLILQTFREII